MSAMQRSRSIRKPEILPADSAQPPEAQARNASPSRLPTKSGPGPPTRSTSTNPPSRGSRAVSAGSGGPTRAAATLASRPPSGGLTRTTARATTAPGSTRPPSGGLTRPTAASSRAARKPAAAGGNEPKGGRYYPPSSSSAPAGTVVSTAARPTSATGSSNSTGPVKRAPMHTRAQSTTSTATIPARPSSQGATTRPLVRNGHTRTVSGGNPAGLSPSASTAASTTAKQSAAGVSQAAPKLRPAFSTLQQHYSPAKTTAPKPSTAAILAPPSPSKLPANVAASAEVARLQAELLQLHLVHRDAAVVDAEWRASARDKLGRRFDELTRRSEGLEYQERHSNEERNLSALKLWGESGSLDEKIQGLDVIINGIWSFGDRGGKYARLVRRFERWIDGVCDIQEERSALDDSVRSGRSLGEKILVEELDNSWKEDFPTITRKLEGWQLQLQDMGEMPLVQQERFHSSVERMLDGAKSMVDGMLAELRMMAGIEREALEREEAWIEKMIQDGDNDTPRAGAIWRTV